eukprot:EG_transcript_22420
MVHQVVLRLFGFRTPSPVLQCDGEGTRSAPGHRASVWDGMLEVADWRGTLGATIHPPPLGPGVPVAREGGVVLLDMWVLETGGVEKGFVHTAPLSVLKWVSSARSVLLLYAGRGGRGPAPAVRWSGRTRSPFWLWGQRRGSAGAEAPVQMQSRLHRRQGIH